MDHKENTERCELKVAQQLIGQLPSWEGKTVTADPLPCQKPTARAIVEKEGDYFLQIKGNQPTLLKHAQTQTAGASLLSRPPAATDESRNAP